MKRLVPILVMVLVASTSHAQFLFTRIARTGDPLPGGGGGIVFTGISSDDPAIGDGGTVAFYASTSGEGGSFAYAGGSINDLVFQNDPRPGGGTLQSMDNPVASAGFVSFHSTNDGLYQAASDGSGPLSVIADIFTLVVDENGDPLGGGETFTRFGEHGRSGTFTVFEANRPGDVEGLYRDDNGSLSLIFEVGDPSPLAGGGLVTSISEPHARGGGFTVTVRSDSGNSGIVGDFGSGIEVLVDENAASPSGLGNFTGFDESSLDGNLIVFQAGTAAGFGVYMLNRSTDTLTTIADSTTTAPGYGVGFAFAGNPSISGSTVLVQGLDGTDGIFILIDGTLHRAFAPGDTLDGRIAASYFDLRDSYSLDGNQFAFGASFEDDTRGYYIGTIIEGGAEVPTTSLPGSIALVTLLLGAGLLALRQRTT